MQTPSAHPRQSVYKTKRLHPPRRLCYLKNASQQNQLFNAFKLGLFSYLYADVYTATTKRACTDRKLSFAERTPQESTKQHLGAFWSAHCLPQISGQTVDCSWRTAWDKRGGATAQRPCASWDKIPRPFYPKAASSRARSQRMKLPKQAASTCWKRVPIITGNITSPGKYWAARTAPAEMLRMPVW